MNLYILDQNYKLISYLDTYSSLEWVTRFYDMSDFVLVANATAENIEKLKRGNILTRADDTKKACVIENVEIYLSATNSTITARGRGIESFLERRIVWTQTIAETGETAENFIRRLIMENAINPANKERVIPHLKLGDKNGFTDKIEKQLTGDKLLTAISAICKVYGYGYKVTLDEGQLIFNLYKGIDRSYKQNVNPFVVFSDGFDNLAETTYSNDESTYCNTALIGGEGEGKDRKWTSIENTSEKELKRYELYVDAKDISSNSGEINETDYTNLLLERGKEKLAEAAITEKFDGVIDSYNTYIYGKDYKLGDIVQVENIHGLKASPRIVEIIESFNENGYKIVPTFETWEAERGVTWQY